MSYGWRVEFVYVFDTAVTDLRSMSNQSINHGLLTKQLQRLLFYMIGRQSRWMRCASKSQPSGMDRRTGKESIYGVWELKKMDGLV